MNRRFFLILLALMFSMPSFAAVAQNATPEASPAAEDQTDSMDGTVAVVGQVGSASAQVSPALFPEPSVVLIDVSSRVTGEITEFTSEQGQILGHMTTPLFPMPGEYRVDLPVSPHGDPIDLDFDGETDTGVQIFALLVASNLTGNSYLQQVEQFGAFNSYLTDRQSNRITEGSFVLYAADEDQAFPTGFGEDGLWFTDDDVTAAVPEGYSIARLSQDGTAELDRSAIATMDTLEAPEEASPDFSNQGILESYNSLIDTLAERYAYTELRGLDWEEIRATYLPAVEQADADQDFASYFYTLQSLAHSIQDAHVDVSTQDFDILLAPNPALTALSGNVGAAAIAVSDPSAPDQPPGDTIVVLSVGEDTPASQAGWVPGTVIHSINGESIEDRYAQLPLLASVGTDEAAHAQKTNYILGFPPGEEVTFEYSLPDSADIETVTLESGDFSTGPEVAYIDQGSLPISLTASGGHTVLKWSDFVQAVDTKLAVLEEALASLVGTGSGLVLDLRGNVGGWEELYEVMASYFFTADNPLSTHTLDWYHYDAKEGGLVLDAATDLEISSPDPAIAFTGPVVILVDNFCVSACEYFTQTMQQNAGAIVVGQHGTAGGGGNIDQIAMPDEITFQYTVGRSTFAGTDVYNIEAKGVTPDVRVPVTLETERSKNEGGDPVMEAGLAEIDRIVDEASEAEAADLLATATAEALAAGTPAAASPEASTEN